MLFDTGTTEEFPWFIVILGPLVILGHFLISYYLRQKNTKKLKRFADDHGWYWNGDLIPQELPYRELLGIPSKQIKISNGFSGSHKGGRFVCAEYRIGWGRQEYSVTMLAIQSAAPPSALLYKYYKVECCPQWYGISPKLLRPGFLGGEKFSTNTILAMLDSIA